MILLRRKNNKKYALPVIILIIISIIMGSVFTIIYLLKLYTIHNNEAKEKELIETIKIGDNIHNGVNNALVDDTNNNVNDDRTNYDYYNNIYNEYKNRYNKESIINSSKEKSDNGTNNRNNTKKEFNGDCIIEIPDIDLSKIVYSGNDRLKHLEKYELVTAASDMNYSNGGNYIICGHASRLYGHSLNRLREVYKGTLIRIWANYEVDEYEVNRVFYVDMNDTNEYCKQNNQKELTIISCAKYISKESYIVIKAIPKKHIENDH